MIAPYQLHVPTTVGEAVELLTRHGDDAHLMAGGTSLVLMMEQGLIRPEHVISLHRIAELQGIARTDEGWLEIGAHATHREIERSPLVRAHCPMLAEAFAKIATVRIRNQATLGGNLAHADPAQDPPPVLIAVAAMVDVVGPSGSREIPVEDLSTDIFTTSLEPGEIIVKVRVPPLAAGARTTYLKFLSRTEDDYATVAVAATVAVRDGLVSFVRLALGAAGPTPIRVRAAEDVLLGQRLDRALVAQAAALAVEAADPLEDTRGSADYKREMVGVFAARALRTVLGLTE